MTKSTFEAGSDAEGIQLSLECLSELLYMLSGTREGTDQKAAYGLSEYAKTIAERQGKLTSAIYGRD